MADDTNLLALLHCR